VCYSEYWRPRRVSSVLLEVMRCVLLCMLEVFEVSEVVDVSDVSEMLKV